MDGTVSDLDTGDRDPATELLAAAKEFEAAQQAVAKHERGANQLYKRLERARETLLQSASPSYAAQMNCYPRVAGGDEWPPQAGTHAAELVAAQLPDEAPATESA